MKHILYCTLHSQTYSVMHLTLLYSTIIKYYTDKNNLYYTMPKLAIICDTINSAHFYSFILCVIKHRINNVLCLFALLLIYSYT